MSLTLATVATTVFVLQVRLQTVWVRRFVGVAPGNGGRTEALGFAR